MASGLICNGISTRGRVVLPEVTPFNALGDFDIPIKLRDLRLSHPTRQWLMVAPGLALSVESGNLVLTTTHYGGGTCSVPLGMVTDGEAKIERRGGGYTLRYTRRDGLLVGESSVGIGSDGAVSIAGGAGLSIGAHNETNAENLQAKIDDLRWTASSHGEILRYGFANNGDDSSRYTCHLTMENAVYEITPETLQIVTEDTCILLSGITPDPGFRVKIFERVQTDTYDYARPLRENIVSLPYELQGRSNRTRFFYVVRLHNLNTATDGTDSNEVYSREPLPAPPADHTRITFDELFYGADTSIIRAQPIATDRYKAQGILLNGYGLRISPAAFAHTPYGTLCATTEATASKGTADGPITIEFVVPGTTTPGRTGSVRFFVCGTESGQSIKWKVEAFNSSGVLLQTIEGAGNEQVVFTRAGHDIARVVFTPSPFYLSAPSGSGLFASGYESIDTLEFENPVAL